MQKILILFLAACGRGPDPVPPSGGAPLAIDGGADPIPIDAAPPERPPPTGYYSLSTDVNDGCTGKKESSTYEQPLLVFVKHDRGKTWMNVPFVVSGNGGAMARSDIGLDGKQRSVRSSPPCGETVIETEVVKATHDTIRLVRTETEGTTCMPAQVKCTRETVLIYTLKKSLCEGPCNAVNIHLLTDGGTDLECKCP